MISLLLSALFVLVCTSLITRVVVRRMRDQALRNQRETLARVAQASEINDQNLRLLRASRPARAAGFDHRRIS